ncbi:ABC transporter ATP-binding protein [Bosea sp. 124]|uniref:ABC transporter ATP-binding protein n=1 Tax=Bosea sp. 124 TaxID=2135642 RepID=UPI000D3D87EE|nr:ABC transporter ATP-binding protein [Bosea sp. 124]PTM41756.1 ABC-type polysaccharide/polyol phosphate transport system ATPase subunit [Bosea sp. 124]
MSADVVIRAEGLGKKYVIGHQTQSERYTTLRDSVGRSLRAWGRSARDIAAGRAIVSGDETEEFWALKDVNFEIRRGDVVGVIGRNGAGKSTLLKVLSRITEPTEGRITIDGRVASLLEVGTGFHPELSGRENIFLNGAILGMSREEIRRKFDEIVAFAGVEKFLDTPVKRYSSGMYVRLAFAVAAHLEPEILIVDEVLAVGDAEFQKKCLGKMQDVAGQGRTVLFVSHSMAAMRALCQQGILLTNGRISAGGAIGRVLEHYETRAEALSEVVRQRQPMQSAAVTRACVSVPGDILLDIAIDAERALSCAVEIKVFDRAGAPVGLASLGGWRPDELVSLEPGCNELAMTIPTACLATGTYRLIIALTNPGFEYYDIVAQELSVEVSREMQLGETRVLSQSEGHGALRLPASLAPGSLVTKGRASCHSAA